jgi:hypothetical protein
VWQNLLKRKYLGIKSITQVDRKQGDFHFLSGLMKVKSSFLNMGYWIINNGEQVRFWEDKWLGNSSLKDKYQLLSSIVRRKNSSIASVMSTIPLNVPFRRALVGFNLIRWHNLCGSNVNGNLIMEHDIFRWNLHQSGQFSV